METIELRSSTAETIAPGRVFQSSNLIVLFCLFSVFFATVAWGTIPASERTVLLNLYTSTNGVGWTDSTNWNGAAGTECTWHGVTCDAGMSHVIVIDLNSNKLSGSLPALGDLTNLQYFLVSGNLLTGTIPSLSGLTNLYWFDVGSNQLIGTIPSFSGLTNLQKFGAYHNHLKGTIPSLSGLIYLNYFGVDHNQLTGTIPSLSGLIYLNYFYVNSNQLMGTIPSLSGLTQLKYFWVDNNFLTGDVPAVPNPNELVNGGVQLCPNYLNHTSNSAWDTATGITPWYQNCPVAPPTYSITYNGNGNTGGNVPVDNGAYFNGQMLMVLGNTGALYKTGNSFTGWNQSANGGGTSYVGGDTFVMGSANVLLYAQWIATGALPVRILETGTPYADIQSAYNAALDGQTIQAQDGLGGQNPLLFDNPHNYDPFSVKLRGGYNAMFPSFTSDTGATLVTGGIEIRDGSIDIGNIIIQ